MQYQNLTFTSVPFITYHSTHGYRLHPQAAQLIRTLPPRDQCSPLSIVGKAKTGKSFLLNQLISRLTTNAPPQQYFPVNDGIGPGTTGIRLFAMDFDDRTLLFLDMEGLGNLSSSVVYEGKLFAFTLLLSSMMIYNNIGPLDLQSLQGFSILIEITKMLGDTLENNKKRVELPVLEVVLRDFALTLQNTEGKVITTKQYLEDALRQLRGASSSNSNKNQIKKIIKDIFPQRQCHAFSLPSEALPISHSSPLRQEFLNQLTDFSSAIQLQLLSNFKSYNGKEVSPLEWLDFASGLVEMANSQQKEGVFKLESLLFQAYRRQQGSIRERFALLAQTCCKKAEAKYQQLFTANEIFSKLEQHQFLGLVQTGENQMKKLHQQLKQGYILACREMEEMLAKQGGSKHHSSHSIDYDNPAVANIKDFAPLYSLYQQQKSQISKLQQRLRNGLEEQRQQKRLRQASIQQIQRFTSIMERINLCQTQKQVDTLYLSFVSELRESGSSLDSKELEANLLKLEVAYLRRKLECSNRAHMQFIGCTHEPENRSKQKVYGSVLKQKIDNRQMSSKKRDEKKEPQSSQSKFYTFHSKQVTPFQGGDSTNNKAFLVPYITIAQDQINIEIIRTLVKQDSRGSTFFQYVLETVLNDKRWVFNRRWKDFNELHNILSQLYPIELLPQFVAGKVSYSDVQMTKKEEIEMRRSQLQDYLRSLLEADSIRNSRIMQKFLKINKEYVPYL